MAKAKNNNQSNSGATLAIIVIVLLAVAAGAYFMNHNNTSNVSNAIDEFSDNAKHGRVATGIREGSEDLRDRSAGEKIGDAIGDAGRNIQDAAHDHQ